MMMMMIIIIIIIENEGTQNCYPRDGDIYCWLCYQDDAN